MKTTPEKKQLRREEHVIIRSEKGHFAKGYSANPGGRPVGSLDFKTKWEILINKIAEKNKITPEEIDEQLLMVAFVEAKKGDYSFWRDIHDRIYGQATKPIEYKGGLNSSIGKLITEDLNNIEDEKERKQFKQLRDEIIAKAKIGRIKRPGRIKVVGRKPSLHKSAVSKL